MLATTQIENATTPAFDELNMADKGACLLTVLLVLAPLPTLPSASPVRPG
jgi:hypothetical protein